MAEIRQKMRGTTAELDQYTPRLGQVVYDITRKELRVGDGAQQGGFRVYSALTLPPIISAMIAQSGYTAYNAARLNGQLPAFYAQSARTLSAGNGLTGGGDLTANRQFDLHLGEFADWNPAVDTWATPRFIGMNGTDQAQQRRLDATQVRSILSISTTAEWQARNLTAGNGLTGGGNLTADRAFALGTPSTVNATSENAVTATSHTHALNLTAANVIAILGYTPANQVRQVIAGNGLTGGGDLTADRTLTLGTPATTTMSSTNSVTATSHSHALTLTNADILGLIGFTPANVGINIIAGNGLTGGGTLAANRTLTLGTPTTVTSSSTNSVTSTGHSHALTLTAADLAAILGYTPANINSPVFTGDPRVPTKAAGDNTTSAASTAFVKTATDAVKIRRVVSGNFTPTLGGLITWAHGLGAKPARAWLYMVCATAELGYAVGDRLGPFSTVQYSNAWLGAQLFSDATHLSARTQNNNANRLFPYVVHKDTGVAAFVTDANWKWSFEAEL